MDMTACFLPKPVTGVNGNGMHTNLSVARKGKNLFYDAKGQDMPEGSAGTSSSASSPAPTTSA
jgi:glutamine synthetase